MCSFCFQDVLIQLCGHFGDRSLRWCCFTRDVFLIFCPPRSCQRGVTFFLFVISDCSLFNAKNMQYNLHSALCFLSFHFWNLLTIYFDCYFVFPALSTLPANVNMLRELYTFWTVELRWVDAKSLLKFIKAGKYHKKGQYKIFPNDSFLQKKSVMVLNTCCYWA